MDNRYANYQSPGNFYQQGGYVPQQQSQQQQPAFHPQRLQQQQIPQNPQFYNGYQTQQLHGFQAAMAAQNPPPPYRPPSQSSQPFAQPQQPYAHPNVVIPQAPLPPPPRMSPSPSHYSPVPQPQHHTSWQYQHPQASPQLQYQPFRPPSQPSPQMQYQQQIPRPHPVPSPTMPQQFLQGHPIVEIPMPPQQNRQQKQPLPPPQPQPQPKQTPIASSPTVVSVSRPKPPPVPQQDPIDYQLLLISLAEEYINAAHSMGSLVALLRKAADAEQYYKLIATGLSCLEVVLRRFRLSPRLEAFLTVRYASLLSEETENLDEMETLVTKGIAICDRNRMFDLKYSLHHLQARILFKTSPKAAFKALDAVISNAEDYQHVPWIYALRFLRVSLSIQISNSSHEMHNAVQNLQAITEWAESQSDDAVRVTSATLEAMVHILSGTSESVEQANHAIATARSLQFQPNIKESIPQVWALLDFVDLACSLVESNPNEAKSKLAVMQKLLDELWETAAWPEDGTLYIPLGQNHDRKLTDSTNGVFEREGNGSDKLSLQWLSKRDLYAVGYAISAIATLLRGSNDSKAHEYLIEGLKLMKADFKASSLDKPDVNPSSSSLASATARFAWRQKMEWNLRLQLGFVYCCQLRWDAASRTIEQLKSGLVKLESSNSDDLQRWIKYLEATIAQGTGDLDKALAIYQTPLLELPDLAPNRLPTVQHDLAILAALNQLLIIFPQSHPQHFRASAILASLEPLALHHHHKAIVSAIWFIKTLVDDEASATIMGRKQVLQHALLAARSMSNQQLLVQCMALMNNLFFRNIVGDQASKSLKTGWVLAKRNEGRSSQNDGESSGGGLWTAVAGSMYADLLERQSALKEAEQLREDTDAIMDRLPEKVRALFIEE